MCLVFHTFGDDFQFQAMGHGDDSAGDGCVFGAFAQATNERLVDFHVIHGEAFQVTQRRIASAEVVDGQFHAQLMQLMERCDDVLHAVEQLTLSQFQLKVARCQAGFLKHLADQTDQLALTQLMDRKVD